MDLIDLVGLIDFVGLSDFLGLIDFMGNDDFMGMIDFIGYDNFTGYDGSLGTDSQGYRQTLSIQSTAGMVKSYETINFGFKHLKVHSYVRWFRVYMDDNISSVMPSTKKDLLIDF